MGRRDGTRRWLPAAVALAALGACGGGGGGDAGGSAYPDSDLRSWGARDASARMAVALDRLWQPSTREVGVIPSWSVVRLPNGREGIVLGAWGNTANAAADVPPMDIVLFEQAADGRQTEATARFIDNPGTLGVGDVAVADFNGDGQDDLVLLPYNETPPTPAAGVAFISGPDGRYGRQALPFAVSAGRAKPRLVNGVWNVFVPGGAFDFGVFRWMVPVWRWTGSSFVQDSFGPFEQLNSTAMAVDDFAGDGTPWIVQTDTKVGPGLTPGTAMGTHAWPLDTVGRTLGTPVTLPAPYFNGKATYAGMESWLDPDSKTTVPNLVSTDLNQDGLPDLLAGSQVWSGARGQQAGVLQVLINQGHLQFADRTDQLAAEIPQTAEIDMSLKLVDLDGSGIPTLLAGQHAWPDDRGAAYDGSFIILNDGTGRLYVAMHDEFENLGRQVNEFVNRQQNWFIPAGVRPLWMAYRNPAGRINYLAMLRSVYRGSVPPGSQAFAFVNVALDLDVMAGFTRALTIPTRNGSRNIRTFAGDDTIHRALNDPDCRIDGGAGTNTAVYPGRRADWVVTKTAGGITVVRVGGGGTDTLRRVQRARFDDQTLDLTAL